MFNCDSYSEGFVRAAIHDIYKTILNNAAEFNNTQLGQTPNLRFITLVAGSPNSGKSTFINYLFDTEDAYRPTQ